MVSNVGNPRINLPFVDGLWNPYNWWLREWFIDVYSIGFTALIALRCTKWLNPHIRGTYPLYAIGYPATPKSMVQMVNSLEILPGLVNHRKNHRNWRFSWENHRKTIGKWMFTRPGKRQQKTMERFTMLLMGNFTLSMVDLSIVFCEEITRG